MPADIWTAGDINQHLASYPATYMYTGEQLVSVNECVINNVAQHNIQLGYENAAEARPVAITENTAATSQTLHTWATVSYYSTTAAYAQVSSINLQVAPTTVIKYYTCPLAGDPAKAHHNYQFMMLHDTNYIYDTYGRLTKILEGYTTGGDATRVTTFSYSGADARPVAVTVTVGTEVGSLTQAADISYSAATYLITSVSLSGTVVTPTWAAATTQYAAGISDTNSASLVTQLFLPHAVSYYYTDNAQLIEVEEDSGARVTDVTYGTNLGDGRPYTLQRATTIQDGSSLLTVVDFIRESARNLIDLVYNITMAVDGRLW